MKKDNIVDKIVELVNWLIGSELTNVKNMFLTVITLSVLSFGDSFYCNTQILVRS